jgi:hypothetical protein
MALLMVMLPVVLSALTGSIKGRKLSNRLKKTASIFLKQVMVNP